MSKAEKVYEYVRKYNTLSDVYEKVAADLLVLAKELDKEEPTKTTRGIN